jgi:16S rRNA (uracil1498-N3)-methyltransferase
MPRLWRAWHPALPDEAGSVVELEPAEAHHVLRVLRLRAGEPLALFDGRGSEWRATLLQAAGAAASVRLEERIVEPAVEPTLALTLYQCLLKPERMEWVVQKATELGVAALCALASERAEPARTVRLERWRRISIEACKQSGRRRLPQLGLLHELPVPGSRAAWILDPSSPLPLGGRFAGEPPGEVWLAAGPQGGFTPGELERAAGAGWTPVGLGPRVLRADTAGVVAAAIALHRWGDLGAATGRVAD